MARNFILTDVISPTGDGVTLNGIGDYLYVGANATLGSTYQFGSGVRATGTNQRIDVAGQIFGFRGIQYVVGFGDIHIFVGGSVSGNSTGIDFGGSSGTVVNAGTISGRRGVNAVSDANVVNSGDINGGFEGIYIGGTGTVANTGTISGITAVIVEGVAEISNYGYIFGGVTTFGFNDTLINRGIITGVIFVGAGDDLVDGIGGRFEKTVFLEGGNDTFWGGDGTDIVRGDAGSDEIDGGGGADRFFIENGDGSDIYDGGAGADCYDARALTGVLVVDLLAGEARNGGATDLLTGIERVFGGTAADRITGNTLANLLRGGAGNDTLIGGDGNDVLFGEAGRNLIYGGNGNDRLEGGGLFDVLNGGAGSDRLHGSYDIDVMTGGTETDQFIFADFEEFIAITAVGLDRITDFLPGTDRIDLSAIDALAAAGDQAFSFIGTGTITAFGQLSYRTTATTTIISIGFNTPSAFDVIRLDGVHVLTATDFVL